MSPCSIIVSDASAPTNVTASPLSGQVGIRVSWTAPTLPTGLPLTGYSIQYKIRNTPDSTHVTAEVGSDESAVNISVNIQLGEEYSVIVATKTTLGVGPYCCRNYNDSEVFVRTS